MIVKLKIEKAFGIKNELVIDSDKRNLIIFAPNGVGKSSIAKTFRQIVRKEIDKFGQEGHGGKESLVLDGMNMEALQEKNLLILTNEELHSSNLTNDPVKNYLEKNIITKKFKEIFTSFNDLIDNLSKEFSFDFKNKPKNQDLHFLFELKQIRNEEKQKILNTIHSLSEGGHFERIDQTKQELEILYKEYDLINETQEILTKHKKRIDLKQIMEIIEKEGQERGYKKELLDVLNIIEDIMDKKLSTKFGYRDNNKEPFQQVGAIIFEKIRNEISKKRIK